MRRLPGDTPSRTDPKRDISDRTLAIATYAVVLFCMACIAIGLIELRSRIGPF